MNPLVRDKIKILQALERAEKTGDSKMIAWCENQLKRYHYGRVEDVKNS